MGAPVTPCGAHRAFTHVSHRAGPSRSSERRCARGRSGYLRGAAKGSAGGSHRVLRATGPSVPNVLAAVLLAVSEQDDMPSHIYFEWSERAPGQNALRSLFAGEGDVPPLTHEILRRAEPDPAKRPVVHVGG